MKIVYKTDGVVIKGWFDKLEDTTKYQLKENEIFGDKFIRPILENGVVVESYDVILAELLLLQSSKNNSILGFESDTDNLIREVVGERSNEYELAEQEAIAFKAGGYVDADVTPSISSDAIANSRTNKEACDLILTMATNWRTMQVALRAQRLLCKAQVKNATTLAELQTVQDTWNEFIRYIKTQIIG